MENKDIRGNAVLRLGELGSAGRGAAPALLEVLDDTTPFRLTITITSYDRGKPSKSERGYRTTTVGAEAAKALWRIERKIELLIAQLRHEDWQVRSNVVMALKEIKDLRTIEPLVEILNTDKIRGVREKAVAVLIELGDPEAVPLLLVVAKDQNSKGRVQAIVGLGELGGVEVSLLIEVLKDKDVEVKAQAVASLGDLGDRELSPLFLELLNDQHSKVQAQAIVALGKIKEVQAIPLLIPVANGPFVLEVVEALGEIGGEQSVEFLIAALEDQCSVVRGRAVVALGKVKDPRALPALIDLLEDKQLQGTVFWALQEITGAVVPACKEQWKEWWELNKAQYAGAQ